MEIGFAIRKFGDAEDSFGESEGLANKVHIRVVNRNTRKSSTTVEGLAFKRSEMVMLQKKIGKKLACGAAIRETDKGWVLLTSGDHGKSIKQILVRDHKFGENVIQIHGSSLKN